MSIPNSRAPLVVQARRILENFIEYELHVYPTIILFHKNYIASCIWLNPFMVLVYYSTFCIHFYQIIHTHNIQCKPFSTTSLWMSIPSCGTSWMNTRNYYKVWIQSSYLHMLTSILIIFKKTHFIHIL